MLALAPDGFVDPYGLGHEAMTLDPARPGVARARARVARRVASVLSRAGGCNIGLDETWELAAERLDEFFAWIATLRALPELDGHEVIIWGDMFSGDPALDREGARRRHRVRVGLRRRIPVRRTRGDARRRGRAVLGRAGQRPVWLSIGGRITNAIENCRNAARAALDHGGRGLLNTDWGDRGHLQQLPISDPGFAFGAAVSWCLDANTRPRPRRGLERARVRRPDRRSRRCVADDRRRAPVRHTADPEPLDPRDAFVLPADPRRPRHHEGHHRRRARRGCGATRRRAHRSRACAVGARRRRAPGRRGRCGRSTCSSCSSTTRGRASPREYTLASVPAAQRDVFAERLATLTDEHRRVVARAQPARRARRQRGLARQPGGRVRNRQSRSGMGRLAGRIRVSAGRGT